MKWFRCDSNLFYNDKIDDAGAHGTLVFLFFLALNARKEYDGIIPAESWDVDTLRRHALHSPRLRTSDVKRAINAAISARLIMIDGAGRVHIIGWGEEWKPKPLSDRERKQASRDRKPQGNPQPPERSSSDRDLIDIRSSSDRDLIDIRSSSDRHTIAMVNQLVEKVADHVTIRDRSDLIRSDQDQIPSVGSPSNGEPPDGSTYVSLSEPDAVSPSSRPPDPGSSGDPPPAGVNPLGPEEPLPEEYFAALAAAGIPSIFAKGGA